MFSIDKLAYISQLRKVNPTEKFIFAIFTMFICIALNNTIVSITVLLLMSAITVFKGEIPFGTYIKLMSLPLAFLIVGIITIAINMVHSSDNLIFGFSILNIRLGCTTESLETATRLFFKSLASVSCLYFLTLSTPVFEVLSVLKKLRVPKLFIELMGLIYRFIFVLLDTVNMIYISQNSRLGYSTLKLSYNSLAKLISSLFISSYKRSQDIYTAMESRCYDGDINLLEESYPSSSKRILLIIITEITLVLIAYGEYVVQLRL
ncbi:cobalt ECF transporter T component CbiQ [Clostridium sp. YIM B02505]|uniref:Cobalt ECF transporter T component CbiQ n=1 Tax=Clostridium yunnanense TaxID=2800325 RepID=A0ABS1ETK1_9CLOT|nr:cobalt ECF transporter T component CbiQ [Clostridium yunnanense]MBK1812706.1 cobalt ECF transporter T component CbiQ [Clostridium yunnanense]